MKYKPYPVYKDSGIEWLGEIPEEWISSKLSRYVQESRPITYGIVQCGPDIAPLGIPYIRPVDMSDEIGIIQELQHTSGEIALPYNRSTLQWNDIVISIGPSFGKVLILPKQLSGANLTQGTARVAINGNNYRRFFFWILRSFYANEYWTIMSSGATFAALTLDNLCRTPVAVPPLPTQKAIATFLDTETTRIDGLIKDYEELISLLQEKRQALISHAITRGLSELVSPNDPEFGEWAKPVKFKDSGVEWLGEIPEGWEVKRVKQVFSLIVDPAPEDNDEVLLSIYTAIGVRPRNELEEKGNRATTTDGYWKVKKGDFIVNKLLAWMGAIGISEYEGVTSPAYDILRPKYLIAGYFYHELFRMPIFAHEMKKYSRGIMDMRLRLYFEEFGIICIPYPTINEQKAIEKYLQKGTSTIDTLITEAESAIELLKEHRSALITNAVTGKINVEGLV